MPTPPEFPESPLPSPVVPSTDVQRTLGDPATWERRARSAATTAVENPVVTLDDTIATEEAPMRFAGRSDEPSMAVPFTTLRQQIVAIVDEVVEAKIDARLASLKISLTDHLEKLTIRQLDERLNKNDVSSMREEAGVHPPSRLLTQSRREEVGATTATSRLDDPIQRELEKVRMDLLFEKQRTSSLVDRVQELTSQRNLGAGAPAAASIPMTTGAPPYAARSDPLYGHRRQDHPGVQNLSSSTTGVPFSTIQLGPHQYGLEDIRPADPDFTAVVSYRRYRLQKTDSDTGPAVSRYVGDFVKLFNPTLSSRKFDGSVPIVVLDFLSSFKRICDEHGVSEGLAILILPHFLFGDARSLIEENFEVSGIAIGGYRTWPEAVQLLLMNYAKDKYIKDALRLFNECTMRDDEDEATFGRRLQKYARLCGGVIDSQKLVTRFCDGLPSYIQPMVLEIIPGLPSFNRYQICVDKAAAIGATQRAVLSQAASSRQKQHRQDRPKTTRINQIEATSPPYQDIGRSLPTYDHSLSPQAVASVLQIGNEQSYAHSHASTAEPSFHTAAVNFSSTPSKVVGSQPTPTDIDPNFSVPVDSLTYDRRYQQRYPRPPQQNLATDICFLCYALGHRQPNCPEAGRPRHDPHLHQRMYNNYMALSDQQREFLRTLGRAPIILQPPVPTGQIDTGDRPAANSSAPTAPAASRSDNSIPATTPVQPKN